MSGAVRLGFLAATPPRPGRASFRSLGQSTASPQGSRLLYLQAESRRLPGGELPRGRPVIRLEPNLAATFSGGGLSACQDCGPIFLGRCPRLRNCGLSGREGAVRVSVVADQKEGVAQARRPRLVAANGRL